MKMREGNDKWFWLPVWITMLAGLVLLGMFIAAVVFSRPLPPQGCENYAERQISEVPLKCFEELTK